MINLDIKKIEKVLNKSIRHNSVSVGFDTADAHTGYALLRTDDKKLYIEKLSKINTNKKDDIKNRMNYFIDSLEDLKSEFIKYKEYKIVVIEDSFLGMNVFTMKDLIRFSTLIFVVYRKFCDYLFYIMPNSARSKIGFNKNEQLKVGNVKPKIISKGKNKGKEKKVDIKLLVQDYLKIKFGLEIEDNDQADGFVLALCGLIKE